jgi:hypothetical protein|tara:strand:- start:230 stop:550 length:321 start_codon:yes stop_codon:yes gene_type:complete
MFKLNFLKKENDLNKILRQQRRERNAINILFTSLWDKHSEATVSKLKEKYSDQEYGQPLYIVDSFHMPHSFVIYNTTKLPHLVRLSNKGIQSEDYLSMIERSLKIT